MKLLALTLILSAFEASTTLTITDTIYAEPLAHGLSGIGTTTRYWDCCKPSCAWYEGVDESVPTPVKTCNADGVSQADYDQQSGCDSGGNAYTCSNQEAIVVNDTFALGFAAVSFTGGADDSRCCACFLLSFQGQLQGKQMLVQITNTGSGLEANHFDIAIPGGGAGEYSQGCTNQWNAPSGGWGDPISGITSESECSELPADLQVGCRYRFEFMEGVNNPGVQFDEVSCPGQLTGITGCSRTD